MAMRSKAANTWTLVKHFGIAGLHKFHTLPLTGRVLIWSVLLFYVSSVVVILIVTPNRAAQFLYDQAANLAATPYGWLILFLASVIISFPPFVGHTTVVTLAGFTFGMKGFWIALPAAVIGSALVFVLLRFYFSDKLSKWLANEKKWRALEEVVVRRSTISSLSLKAFWTQRAKGLPLVILIRVSPFPPWAYSNSLFASIKPVELWQFVIATSFIFPRVLLQVFIGSRIAALSDGNQREKMDSRKDMLTPVRVLSTLIAQFR
ncbi:hypothetical protein APHAL10511_001782 [Amanita phalloides]|nr:hypothetical protein APHAL10511_001782 [Amanita phalloides]